MPKLASTFQDPPALASWLAGIEEHVPSQAGSELHFDNAVENCW
jgi:hypothetical protein